MTNADKIDTLKALESAYKLLPQLPESAWNGMHAALDAALAEIGIELRGDTCSSRAYELRYMWDKSPDTERQDKMMQMRIDGLTYKAIAAAVGLNQSTVYQKMKEVSRRHQAKAAAENDYDRYKIVWYATNTDEGGYKVDYWWGRDRERFTKPTS